MVKEREDIKMIETDMNQQKLKMLIKFDKIKFLEDNYNQSVLLRNKDPSHMIRLEADVDQDELFRLAE